jgi:SAM-dependent methyltransferase
MSVFKDYSAYYDLIYKDKDYNAEVNYIHELITRYHKAGGNILDIGCGTGKHAELLGNKGYKVHGFDYSQDMVDIANTLIAGQESKLSFSQGDARTFSFEGKFDVITSLFHVTSYLNDNDGLSQYFGNVRKHLSDDGIFIFDFWYGPGVLTDRPLPRIKEMESDKLQVTRFAQPELHGNANVVDVNYKLVIKDKIHDKYYEVTEKHSMRYFFKPELDLFLQKAGLNVLGFYDWLTFNQPGYNTWAGVIICNISK